MSQEKHLGVNLFSPKKFSDLVAWYDAAQITGISTDDPISQWDDLSGNGYHLTQANSTSQPLYKMSTELSGGMPYVYFDGTDDYMAESFGSTYNQPNTIIVLGKFRKNNSVAYAIDGIDGTHRNTILLYSVSKFAYITAGSPKLSYVYPEVGNYGIVNMKFNGANSVLRDGSSIVMEDNVGSNPFAGITVGCAYNISYFGDINVCETIIYNKQLNDYEVYEVENYLAKKWGLKTFSLLATDDFTRANSTSSMGNCLSNQTWTAGAYQDVNMPTIGISSNYAYFPTSTGTDSHAYIESGRADCVITAKITFDAGGDSDKGIIFRREDENNYFFLHVDSAVDQLVLSRCLAGVRSDIASAAGMTVSPGNVVHFRCYLLGSAINCGSALSASAIKYIETTDANLTTATKHGLYNHSGNTSMCDYFAVDDFPVP